MKKQVVYMLITHDKYELPMAIADTPDEMAKIAGVKRKSVIQMACRKKNGGRGNIIKVEFDEST